MSPYSTLDDSLGLMTVGTVAHVVKERRGLHLFGAVPLNFETGECLSCEMSHPDAVFESRVIRRGVDQSNSTQLLDMPESLNWSSVQ